MPELTWQGKAQVKLHHLDVPFHFLNKQYDFHAAAGSPDNRSDNILIHGDNLLALKSLLPEFGGRIHCIYIDPPYNTGNENWVYNDNVNDPRIQKWLGEVVGKEGEDFSRHDKWLCMMYPRLKLLKQLLAEDGVIFISIDDNEQANLRLICDEIFGYSNFVSNIHWRRSESQNNNATHLSTVGEHIIVYAKNKNKLIFNKIELQDSALKEYRHSDEKGYFRRGTIVDNTRGNHLLTVTSPTGIQKTIKSIRKQEDFEAAERDGLVYWTKTGTPYLKIHLNKTEGQIASNWFDNVGVNEDATDTLTEMNLEFQFSKPYTLIQKILEIASQPHSLILDSFSGSGTTAHAVLSLNQKDGGNRRFIGVEMMDYAENITAERIRRVIDGYGSGNKAVIGTGGGFTFYTVGDRLFDENKNLNPNAPIAAIRDYIAYTEALDTVWPSENGVSPHALGYQNGTAYVFYYELHTTALSWDFLNTLNAEGLSEKPEQWVIYADTNVLTDEQLKQSNIIFKRIPRDIYKL